MVNSRINKLVLLLVAFTEVFQTAFAQQGHIASKGVAKMLKDGNFQSYNFSRHAIGDNDILIDIMHTGICHSDIHTTKGNGANVMPFHPELSLFL